MPTWRRILTTADTTNNNLASQDLTVPALSDSSQSFERVFNLPGSTGGAALIFKGTLIDDYPNTPASLLRVQADADAASTTKNFLYTPSLRIGNFDTDGPANGRPDFCGYSLPQFSQSHQGGRFLVTDTSWTESLGDTLFKNFEDIVGPGHDGVGDEMELDDLTSSDSMLVYDHSLDKFRHLKLTNFPRSYFIQSGRNQELNYGSWFMKGVNGVPIEQDEDGSGIVVPEDCVLTKISLGFYKVSGGSNHRRKVRIWVNGSTAYETTYAGVGFGNGEFVYKAYDAIQVSAAGGVTTTGFNLNAGDRLAFEVYNTSSYSGLGKNFQVNAILNTITDGTPEP